jgi:signal transduction histidine kinase
MTIDGGNLWENAAPTRLEQIAINLLTYAAQYSESVGHIWFSTGHEDSDPAETHRFSRSKSFMMAATPCPPPKTAGPMFSSSISGFLDWTVSGGPAIQK